MTDIYENVSAPNPNDDILAQIEMGAYGQNDSEAENEDDSKLNHSDSNATFDGSIKIEAEKKIDLWQKLQDLMQN